MKKQIYLVTIFSLLLIVSYSSQFEIVYPQPIIVTERDPPFNLVINVPKDLNCQPFLYCTCKYPIKVQEKDCNCYYEFADGTKGRIIDKVEMCNKVRETKNTILYECTLLNSLASEVREAKKDATAYLLVRCGDNIRNIKVKFLYKADEAEVWLPQPVLVFPDQEYRYLEVTAPTYFKRKVYINYSYSDKHFTDPCVYIGIDENFGRLKFRCLGFNKVLEDIREKKSSEKLSLEIPRYTDNYTYTSIIYTDIMYYELKNRREGCNEENIKISANIEFGKVISESCLSEIKIVGRIHLPQGCGIFKGITIYKEDKGKETPSRFVCSVRPSILAERIGEGINFECVLKEANREDSGNYYFKIFLFGVERVNEISLKRYNFTLDIEECEAKIKEIRINTPNVIVLEKEENTINLGTIAINWREVMVLVFTEFFNPKRYTLEHSASVKLKDKNYPVDCKQEKFEQGVSTYKCFIPQIVFDEILKEGRTTIILFISTATLLFDGIKPVDSKTAQKEIVVYVIKKEERKRSIEIKIKSAELKEEELIINGTIKGIVDKNVTLVLSGESLIEPLELGEEFPEKSEIKISLVDCSKLQLNNKCSGKCGESFECNAENDVIIKIKDRDTINYIKRFDLIILEIYDNDKILDRYVLSNDVKVKHSRYFDFSNPIEVILPRGWSMCFISPLLLNEYNKEFSTIVYFTDKLSQIRVKGETIEYVSKKERIPISYEKLLEMTNVYSGAYVYSRENKRIKIYPLRLTEISIPSNTIRLVYLKNITDLKVSGNVEMLRVYWLFGGKWYMYDAIEKEVYVREGGKWVEVTDENLKKEILDKQNPCKAYWVYIRGSGDVVIKL
jgi:hypothetical protein